MTDSSIDDDLPGTRERLQARLETLTAAIAGLAPSAGDEARAELLLLRASVNARLGSYREALADFAFTCQHWLTSVELSENTTKGWSRH